MQLDLQWTSALNSGDVPLLFPYACPLPYNSSNFQRRLRLRLIKSPTTRRAGASFSAKSPGQSEPSASPRGANARFCAEIMNRAGNSKGVSIQMKHVFAMVVVLVSGFALSASGQTPAAPVASTAHPAQAGDFVSLPQDINCFLASQRLGIEGGTKVSGSVDSVTCAITGGQNKDLPLASHEVSNGVIETSSFGELRVSPAGPFQFAIAIHPDKIEALREFLGGSVHAPPAPAAAYVQISPDIKCSIEGITVNMVSDAQGNVTYLPGGSVRSVTCSFSGTRKQIALASAEIKDGGVQTASFGILKMVMHDAVTGNVELDIRSDLLPSLRAFLGAPPLQPPASAASGASLRVAFINFQQAVAGTDDFKRPFAEIQKKYEPKRLELKALSDEIAGLEKQLSAGKLSEQEKASLESTIEQKKKKMQDDTAAAQKDFTADAQAVLEKVGTRVLDALTAEARQQGLDIVIDKGGSPPSVLYLSHSIQPADIQMAVMERFNGSAAHASSPPAASSPDLASSSPSVTVTKYLTAAATLDSGATRQFLSASCKNDVVDEFKSNQDSGWKYSASESLIGEGQIDAGSGKATVKTQLVYKGGDPPTMMVKDRTFYLVREKGVWMISGMDPAPETSGPGVRPL